jgi:hypothetical protein
LLLLNACTVTLVVSHNFMQRIRRMWWWCIVIMGRDVLEQLFVAFCCIVG